MVRLDDGRFDFADEGQPLVRFGRRDLSVQADLVDRYGLTGGERIGAYVPPDQAALQELRSIETIDGRPVPARHDLGPQGIPLVLFTPGSWYRAPVPARLERLGVNLPPGRRALGRTGDRRAWT